MSLDALIARVEGATENDRELEEAVHAALFPDHYFAQLADAPENTGCMMYRMPKCTSSALRVTASIDAAVGLAEIVLPDHGWFLRRDDTDASGKRAAPVYNAALLYPDALRVCASSAQHLNPALAVLSALLRALKAIRAEDKG